MKAIGIRAFGGPEVLEFVEVAKPVPGPRDLLVRVRAFSVNPIDAKLRRGAGSSGGNAPSLDDGPLVVGWDAAGVVEAVGAQVGRFLVGDEVYFAGDIGRPGCYAEYAVVDERIAAIKPVSLDFPSAAALPLTGLTAWEALVENLGASETTGDKTILVVGGAGGVGSMATQIAKRVCGLQVVATASRPESVEYCRALGADVVVDHRHDFLPQLQENRIDGVDYILNCADPSNFSRLVPILNPLGRICGIVGGPALKHLDVSGLVAKRGTLTFELMFTRTRLQVEPEKQGQILSEIARLVDEDILQGTRRMTLHWSRIQEAHHQIDTGHTLGKIVLVVP